MSYSGYLFYSSQDVLGEPNNKYNLLSPQFKDVESGCKTCNSKFIQKKHVNMGVPYLMITISIAQVLIFFSNTGTDILSFDPWQRHEIWRYLTYMLIHADWCHLVSNVMLQIVAGIIIEKDQSCWRSLLVYLGGVMGGSLASIDHTIIVGASSGAYALFFSQIPQVLLNHNSLKYFKSRVAYLIICIIAGSLFEAYMVLAADPILRGPYEVAFHSHLAGLVSGVIIGFVLFKENHKVVRYTFSFALFYLFIFAVVYNIYRPLPIDVVQGAV